MDVGSAKLLAAGIATLGMMGVGIGLGMLFSRLIEGISRNPEAKKDILSTGLIGFALTESIALLMFVIVMIILFVV